MKRYLLCTASSIVLITSLLTSTTAVAEEYTDEQIKQYIATHSADEVASKMRETGVNVERIQKATGASDEQVSDYVNKSKNSYLQDAYDKSLGRKFTDNQIKDYLSQNINDSQAIASAMKKYGVNLDRIQQATGFNRAQISDYVEKSGNSSLKTSLSKWHTSDYDKLPEMMQGGFVNGNPVAIIRDVAEIDKLPIWDSMHPNAAAFYKQQLKTALESDSTAGTNLTIGGMTMEVPGAGNPKRSYPTVTHSQLIDLKNKLAALGTNNVDLHKKLLTCIDSGKSDCSSERSAFQLARNTSSELQAKIYAAELELNAPTDPQKKLYASAEAARLASNAVLACYDAQRLTGNNCVAQAELAKSTAEKAEADAKALFDACDKKPGANCIGLRTQYDGMTESKRKAAEKLAELKVAAEDQSARRIARRTSGDCNMSSYDCSGINPSKDNSNNNPQIHPKLPDELAKLYEDNSNNNPQIHPKLPDELAKLYEDNSKSTSAVDVNKDLSEDLKKIRDSDIDAFIRANLDNPQAIADAMKKYGVDLARIQAATKYTREQMVDYINKSRNPDLIAALKTWPAPTVTTTQVNTYIRSNLNDPAKIASAMTAYNVNLDQIQSATGYTHQQMVDYINASNNPELKKALSEWKAVQKSDPWNFKPRGNDMPLPNTGQPTNNPDGIKIPIPNETPIAISNPDGIKIPIPNETPIAISNPDEKCGINGGGCASKPIPLPKKDQPSPNDRGKYNPDEKCGIDGRFCKTTPETDSTVKSGHLPATNPDQKCGLDGSMCTTQKQKDIKIYKLKKI